jgi:hypothetical protein
VESALLVRRRTRLSSKSCTMSDSVSEIPCRDRDYLKLSVIPAYVSVYFRYNPLYGDSKCTSRLAATTAAAATAAADVKVANLEKSVLPSEEETSHVLSTAVCTLISECLNEVKTLHDEEYRIQTTRATAAAAVRHIHHDDSKLQSGADAPDAPAPAPGPVPAAGSATVTSSPTSESVSSDEQQHQQLQLWGRSIPSKVYGSTTTITQTSNMSPSRSGATVITQSSRQGGAHLCDGTSFTIPPSAATSSITGAVTNIASWQDRQARSHVQILLVFPTFPMNRPGDKSQCSGGAIARMKTWKSSTNVADCFRSRLQTALDNAIIQASRTLTAASASEPTNALSDTVPLLFSHAHVHAQHDKLRTEAKELDMLRTQLNKRVSARITELGGALTQAEKYLRHTESGSHQSHAHALRPLRDMFAQLKSDLKYPPSPDDPAADLSQWCGSKLFSDLWDSMCNTLRKRSLFADKVQTELHVANSDSIVLHFKKTARVLQSHASFMTALRTELQSCRLKISKLLAKRPFLQQSLEQQEQSSRHKSLQYWLHGYDCIHHDHSQFPLENASNWIPDWFSCHANNMHTVLMDVCAPYLRFASAKETTSSFLHCLESVTLPQTAQPSPGRTGTLSSVISPLPLTLFQASARRHAFVQLCTEWEYFVQSLAKAAVQYVMDHSPQLQHDDDFDMDEFRRESGKLSPYCYSKKLDRSKLNCRNATLRGGMDIDRWINILLQTCRTDIFSTAPTLDQQWRFHVEESSSTSSASTKQSRRTHCWISSAGIVKVIRVFYGARCLFVHGDPVRTMCTHLAKYNAPVDPSTIQHGFYTAKYGLSREADQTMLAFVRNLRTNLRQADVSPAMLLNVRSFFHLAAKLLMHNVASYCNHVYDYPSMWGITTRLDPELANPKIEKQQYNIMYDEDQDTLDDWAGTGVTDHSIAASLDQKQLQRQQQQQQHASDFAASQASISHQYQQAPQSTAGLYPTGFPPQYNMGNHWNQFPASYVTSVPDMLYSSNARHVCAFFSQGNCSYELSCANGHDIRLGGFTQELSSPNTPILMCQEFCVNGMCASGNACKFLHDVRYAGYPQQPW